MTEQEFKELVKKLRETQRNYFATRVDLILWPKIEDTQKSMF